MFPTKHNIHKRVMATVKGRIAKAQEEHDQHCAEEDAKRDAEIEAVEARCEENKAAHADAIVTRILSNQ